MAYHEAGHALVGALMPDYDPVTKISIVPRGAAGGLTFFAPSEERLESGLYRRARAAGALGPPHAGPEHERMHACALTRTPASNEQLRAISPLPPTLSPHPPPP